MAREVKRAMVSAAVVEPPKANVALTAAAVSGLWKGWCLRIVPASDS